MPSHLKPNIANKDVLNAALDLGFSFFFPKQSICSFKVEDVFDGNNILDRVIRGKKHIDTSPELKAFFAQHIEYLRQHYSVEQNAPLFPGYEGERGKKKLQRHIRKYSTYRDFHELVNESYKNAEKPILNNNLDIKERLKKISRITGKSERAIKHSLYEKFNPTIIRQKRKLKAPKSNELSGEVTEKEQNEDKLAITPHAKPVTKIEPSKKASPMDLLREAIEENK